MRENSGGTGMTNREWLESLSDERFTNAITTKIIARYFLSNGDLLMTRGSIKEWLQAEHEETDNG